MNCLDMILDRLRTHPAETVTLHRRTFVAARLTIQGRADLSVEKQLDLWAHTHGLLCVHDSAAQSFAFQRQNPTPP